MSTRTAFLLPLLLAACHAGTPTDRQPQSPAGSDALAQVGRWKLQSATDAQGRPIAAAVPRGKGVHALVFAEGRLAIEGGCNHIGGSYRFDASGRLVVSDMQSTLRACVDEQLMAADSAVSALMEGSAAWSIAESYPEQLSLDHSGGGRSSWVAVRPAQ